MKKSRFRPRLEALEERWLPSTYTWRYGGVDHNWSTNGNWTSSDGGTTYPKDGDTAKFDTSDNCTLDVAITGKLAEVDVAFILGGKLTLNKDLNVRVFNQTTSTTTELPGGQLNIYGASSWTTGNLGNAATGKDVTINQDAVSS